MSDIPLSVFPDHNSGNSSLDTLLALLQTEGAMIEEETEVSSQTPIHTHDNRWQRHISCLQCFCQEVITIPTLLIFLLL